ncbi:MAG: MBL fold metallo-hydrolase [Thermoplasmatota archaeon]
MVEVTLLEAGPFDCNIFLLRKGETSLLLDSGSGFYSNDLLHNIRRSLAGSELSGIVLTHEHFDHSGGAGYLMDKLDTRLYSSPECARALREADGNLTGSFLFGAQMEPLSDIVEIGSELKVGEIEFEVHSTPGHAPGLICLIEKDGRKLFCGDLVFCDGGVGRWDLPGGNLSLLKDSIDRASGWDISALYPGHGRYEERDPAGQIQLARTMISPF